MNDLTQCAVIREDFQRWLNLGKAPITLHQGDKAVAVLTRLEKSSSMDYLYSAAVEKDGGISWNNSLKFSGVWDRQHQALYMTEDGLSCVTTGQYPFASAAVPSIKEGISSRINQRVEGIIANDRRNLAVQDITSWRASKALREYLECGARSEALEHFFGNREPGGQFHSRYTLDKLPEAAFMAWLYDPEYFVETEAEQYFQSHQEEFLLDFLKNDALLKAYQALIEDTDSPIYRMKAITGAIKDSRAKNVTVSIQKNGKELTFKTEASSLTGYRNWYSIQNLPSQDRWRFKELFGRSSDYYAEEITKITYGKKTIYEAPPVPTEDMAGPEIGGMNFG